MTLDGEYEPSPWEPVAEQVRLYEETDGREGNELNGYPVIILTTIGRRSGKVRKTPLMRVEQDGRYVVIASLGGAPTHPVWYLNVQANPEVTLQDGASVLRLRARTATPDEKAAWWPVAVAAYPDYDVYQRSTERDIPVVILDPID